LICEIDFPTGIFPSIGFVDSIENERADIGEVVELEIDISCAKIEKKV